MMHLTKRMKSEGLLDLLVHILHQILKIIDVLIITLVQGKRKLNENWKKKYIKKTLRKKKHRQQTSPSLT